MVEVAIPTRVVEDDVMKLSPTSPYTAGSVDIRAACM